MSSEADTIAIGKSASLPMPPYTSFSSLKSSLAVLAEHGVPGRIDRSVWGTKFSGAVVSQILTAYRFLRLMDSDGLPTQALRRLAENLNKEGWAGELRSVLEASYSAVLDLDLQTATANQLYERFRTLYGADGDTGRKCVTFFLHAAQEASIPVSKYLLTNVKPRGAAGGSRRKPRAGKPQHAPETPEPLMPERQSVNTITERLLEKFPEFDPSWPDEIKAKWFTGFQELMDRAKAP